MCAKKPFSGESFQQKQVVKHSKASETRSEPSAGTDDVVGNPGENSLRAVLQAEVRPP